jgi:hypothetical protein
MKLIAHTPGRGYLWNYHGWKHPVRKNESQDPVYLRAASLVYHKPIKQDLDQHLASLRGFQLASPQDRDRIHNRAREHLRERQRGRDSVHLLCDQHSVLQQFGHDKFIAERRTILVQRFNASAQEGETIISHFPCACLEASWRRCLVLTFKSIHATVFVNSAS